MAPYTEGENASVAEMMASSTAEIVRELITAHKERKERVKKAIVYPAFSKIFNDFYAFSFIPRIFMYFLSFQERVKKIPRNFRKLRKVLESFSIFWRL